MHNPKTCRLQISDLTLQPLDLCFDWNDSLEWQHAQLKTGPGQGLYEELHRVVEGEFIVKSSHTVVVEEGRLLLVSHLGQLWKWLFWVELLKLGDKTKTGARGTGTAHMLHTSCYVFTAEREKNGLDGFRFCPPLQFNVKHSHYWLRIVTIQNFKRGMELLCI